MKTYKFDVLWHAKWKLWKMTTDAGLSNTYQTNYNYPGTKQPALYLILQPVGAKLGNMSNSDAVYPQLYPEICAQTILSFLCGL